MELAPFVQHLRAPPGKLARSVLYGPARSERAAQTFARLCNSREGTKKAARLASLAACRRRAGPSRWTPTFPVYLHFSSWPATPA